MYRVPTAQGKQGKLQKKRKIPVRQNTGNLEILSKHGEFGQVVNFLELILKVKYIFIFVLKISNFFLSWISLPSQFCVCNSHKSRKLAQGKFAVGQGRNREFENAI